MNQNRFAVTPAAIALLVRLLTTRSATRYAAVSRATLYRAARRGDLHPVRLTNRATRWAISDLDAWIDRAAAAAADGEVRHA